MQWLDWNTSESGIGPTTPADQYPPYIRAHLWNIYRVCVCAWKALNQRVSAGGQEPMTVCPGQRRPDSVGVKTCLQISDFGYGQVAKP